MNARWRTVIDTLDMLPALIREARRVRGLSLREAADQIDYSYADLCRFERGFKQPTLATVLRMLHWLGTVPPSPPAKPGRESG